jgi:cytochrome c-type biogenesis protein CcmH
VRPVLLALALVLLVPVAALGVSVDEVAREVRCPTCNTPLNVSNAPVADRMRVYIADRIERGWSKDQIIDGLVAEFGPTIRTTPPKSGFNLVAWLVPALAVLAGLAAIPIITRLWARRRPALADAPPPTGLEAKRLDDELDRFGPA